MHNNNLYTVITGASKGLGRELAIECAQNNINLILIALPSEDLKSLCEQLMNKFKIKAQYYEVDLTEIDSILNLFNKIKENYKINGIINNAGLGGSMPFNTSSIKYLDNMILLNIRALSLLTRLFVPELMEHKKSYILNIASMAAYSPIPYKTVYPASKAYVYYFSTIMTWITLQPLSTAITSKLQAG